MADDRFTLVGARLAVLETLRRGDWEAIPLDGEAARILIVEVEDGTAWLVTVEEAAVFRVGNEWIPGTGRVIPCADPPPSGESG